VGAIALVTVVAVFLPMVLENEPKSVNQDISVQIPSQSSGAFTSKIVPVAPAPETKPDAAPTESPARAPDKAQLAEPRGGAKAPETVAKAPDKPLPEKHGKGKGKAEKAASTEKGEPKAARSGFVVQVAALNDGEKAKAMQQQISASGLASYTEVVPTTKGNVTRVRVGPFPNRQAAEKARDQLKGMGLAGNVIPPK
jgi:DedD protein